MSQEFRRRVRGHYVSARGETEWAYGLYVRQHPSAASRSFPNASPPQHATSSLHTQLYHPTTTKTGSEDLRSSKSKRWRDESGSMSYTWRGLGRSWQNPRRRRLSGDAYLNMTGPGTVVGIANANIADKVMRGRMWVPLRCLVWSGLGSGLCLEVWVRRVSCVRYRCMIFFFFFRSDALYTLICMGSRLAAEQRIFV